MDPNLDVVVVLLVVDVVVLLVVVVVRLLVVVLNASESTSKYNDFTVCCEQSSLVKEFKFENEESMHFSARILLKLVGNDDTLVCCTTKINKMKRTLLGEII